MLILPFGLVWFLNGLLISLIFVECHLVMELEDLQVYHHLIFLDQKSELP